jgi:hypothetical protein
MILISVAIQVNSIMWEEKLLTADAGLFDINK